MNNIIILVHVITGLPIDTGAPTNANKDCCSAQLTTNGFRSIGNGKNFFVNGLVKIQSL
jgi:hypothetical protein